MPQLQNTLTQTSPCARAASWDAELPESLLGFKHSHFSRCLNAVFNRDALLNRWKSLGFTPAEDLAHRLSGIWLSQQCRIKLFKLPMECQRVHVFFFFFFSLVKVLFVIILMTNLGCFALSFLVSPQIPWAIQFMVLSPVPKLFYPVSPASQILLPFK